MLPKKRKSVTFGKFIWRCFSCVIDCVVGNVPSRFVFPFFGLFWLLPFNCAVPGGSVEIVEQVWVSFCFSPPHHGSSEDNQEVSSDRLAFISSVMVFLHYLYKEH